MKQNKPTFTHRNIINLFIVDELETWSRDLNTNFELGSCLLGAEKQIKNALPDEYGYSGYGIGFDASSQFFLPNGQWGKICYF